MKDIHFDVMEDPSSIKRGLPMLEFVPGVPDMVNGGCHGDPPRLAKDPGTRFVVLAKSDGTEVGINRPRDAKPPLDHTAKLPRFRTREEEVVVRFILLIAQSANEGLFHEFHSIHRL